MKHSCLLKSAYLKLMSNPINGDGPRSKSPTAAKIKPGTSRTRLSDCKQMTIIIISYIFVIRRQRKIYTCVNMNYLSNRTYMISFHDVREHWNKFRIDLSVFPFTILIYFHDYMENVTVPLF